MTGNVFREQKIFQIVVYNKASYKKKNKTSKEKNSRQNQKRNRYSILFNKIEQNLTKIS